MNDITNIIDHIAMKTHLDMLPGMIDKCHKHFIPQVYKLTDMSVPELVRSPERFSIEFIEAMPVVSGLRFELQINIDGLNLFEVQVLLHNLKPLCSWEPDPFYPGFELNGYQFMIGDGDDAQAVYMRNGKLCVWVRAWRDGVVETVR